jgi:hypothetical protein
MKNAFFVLTEQPILEIMVVYKNNIENSSCVQNRYLKMQLCSNCVISQIFFLNYVILPKRFRSFARMVKDPN